MAAGEHHDSARYVLRVRGILTPDWDAWFPGFTAVHDATGDIVLSGEVVDRAALYGILSRARDLGLTIISVERRAGTL